MARRSSSAGRRFSRWGGPRSRRRRAPSCRRPWREKNSSPPCVGAAVGPARRVVDLFAGIGTFALRLAESAEVHAVEADAAALAALDRAARNATMLRPVTVERRDLFRRPLAGDELARFDAAVFDPPRAGAEMQARALAAANLATLAAVSCNAQTFARDAGILAEAGYRLESVTPIDQFRHSQHIEIVGVFRRAAERGRSRRLLG